MNSRARKQFKRGMTMFGDGTVLAIGIVIIALPGSAFIVIPAELAILALKFVRAGRWLHSARDFAEIFQHLLDERVNPEIDPAKRRILIPASSPNLFAKEKSRMDESVSLLF